MCHRAKKIVYPSPSYGGKGPRVHDGWTTCWLSCQQTDSDQWCIIHIFNLNPVHLDLGNELHRQFVAWISWYQYFWPNSISKDISLIIFWKLYFGCNLLFGKIYLVRCYLGCSKLKNCFYRLWSQNILQVTNLLPSLGVGHGEYWNFQGAILISISAQHYTEYMIYMIYSISNHFLISI